MSAFEAEPGDLGELGVHALPAPLAPPKGPRLSAPMARPALRTGEHRAPPAPTPQRRAALAGFRRELMVGISRLQQHVSGCASQGATFDLSLESVAGGVKVVSATVASRGAATEAALSCAQSALRGQLIPASTQSGRQWRMPLVVR